MEYIESTGTQWIDTGIIPDSNTVIEATYSLSDDSGGYQYIFGCYGANSTSRLQFDVSTNMSEGSFVGWGRDYSYQNFTPIDKEQHTIKGAYDGFYIDDKLVYKPTSNEFTNGAVSIHMFGRNGNGSAGNLATGLRIHEAKIKTNSTEAHFIPVVDKNGVACLYDKVSGELFYNKGTGNFTTGPRIEEHTPEPPITPDTPDVPDIPSEPKPTPTPTPPKPPTFRAGDVLLQVGANSGAYNQLGIDLTFDLDEFTSDVSTSSNASKTLESMDKLKELLVQKCSTVGAQRNRLESVINASTLRKENLSSSYSTMMDTDFALETTKLTKQQILKQATSSLLAQTNMLPNIALTLLR